MISDRVLGALGVLLFAPTVFWLFKMWFYELRFYRERNWNFTVDSKYSGWMKWGDIVTPRDEGSPVGNRARVCFWLPLMALVFAVGAVLSLFFLMKR